MKKILIISLLIFAIFIVSCTNAIEDSMEVEGDHNDEETTDTEVESAQLTEDADPGTAETIVEQDELADADTRTESDESTIKVIELTASNWEFEVTSADEIHEGDTVQIKVTGTQGSHGLKFEDLDVRNREWIVDGDFFHSDTAREIARTEWTNTFRYCYGGN